MNFSLYIATVIICINSLVWADNADAISVAYSGTGALKTDFTRTGKRTILGALKDLQNSTIRYFANNYTDGRRQDSYDLFMGKFQLAREMSPFDTPRSLRVTATVTLGAMAVMMLALMLIFSPARMIHHLTEAEKQLSLQWHAIYTIFYMFLWLGVLWQCSQMIKQYSHEFIDWPRLARYEHDTREALLPSKQ